MNTPNSRSNLELRSEPKTSEAYVELTALPGSASGAETYGLLGYRRKRERDTGNGDSEDYARLVSDSDFVVAVLADGVSTSFHGEIAAKAVVDALMPELQSGDPLSPLFAQRLVKTLQAAAKEARNSVSQYPLRPDLSPVKISLLEERRSNGSQAVFGALVFHRPTGRLMIYQLGDVRIHVFQESHNGFHEQLVDSNKEARFSTFASANTDDKRLEHELVVKSFTDVAGVILHSDGVDDHWGTHPAGLSLSQHSQLTAALDTWALKDDVSVVGILTEPFRKWTAGSALMLNKPKPAGNRFEAMKEDFSTPYEPGRDQLIRGTVPVLGTSSSTSRQRPGTQGDLGKIETSGRKAVVDTEATSHAAVGQGLARGGIGTKLHDMSSPSKFQRSRKYLILGGCVVLIASVSFTVGWKMKPVSSFNEVIKNGNNELANDSDPAELSTAVMALEKDDQQLKLQIQQYKERINELKNHDKKLDKTEKK